MPNHDEEVLVRVEANGCNQTIREASSKFMHESISEKYSYNFYWMGRPIIQYPQDIVAVQEIVWKVKPDLIVETGIARGGSLILSASLLGLLELSEAAENSVNLDPLNPKRFVLGVDIDIREHNLDAIKSHPMASRIKMIQGSSVSKDVVKEVWDYASGFRKVMVFLDSNHSHSHVLEELKAYSGLVSQGSYCVVFDTICEDLPKEFMHDRPWGPGDNPKTAVFEFLKNNKEFQIDKHIENKLLITAAPSGFLVRKGG